MLEVTFLAAKIKPEKYYLVDFSTNTVMLSRGVFDSYDKGRSSLRLGRRQALFSGRVILENLVLGNLKLEEPK